MVHERITPERVTQRSRVGGMKDDALTIEQGAEVEGRFAHRVPARAAKADDGSAPTLTLAS